MKLGIVGTGTIVEEVLPVLQQVKGLSCYGICGTKRSEAKAEKLKEQYQMQLAVSDYEKLLDSEIDTVYIAVPNLLHFEMAKEAIIYDRIKNAKIVKNKNGRTSIECYCRKTHASQ